MLVDRGVGSEATVVVTGGGSGIGLSIAQAFHAAGAQVALGDVDEDAVERAAAGLGSGRVFSGGIDVRDEASVGPSSRRRSRPWAP